MQAALGKANLKDGVVRDGHDFRAARTGIDLLGRFWPPPMSCRRTWAIKWPPPATPVVGRKATRNTRIGCGSPSRTTWALAISRKPGIEQASVIYDVSKPSGFKEKVATAIVYVKPAGDVQLDEAMVLDIRGDVAGAYSELKPENVTVSDRNGRTWRGEIGNAAALIAENRYRSMKRACEQDLKGKILGALKAIPNVAVELNVELDRGQIEKSNAALPPVSARVSVGVPSSYFQKVWESRNPASPGSAERTPDSAALEQIRIEETVNIQRSVAALLPPMRLSANAPDAVTVTTFQDISTTAAPSTDLAKTALHWIIASWKTLGGVALALIVLIVLRSSVRAKTAASDRDSSDAESKDDGKATAIKTIREPAEPAPLAAPHWRRRAEADDRSIRRELSALVEDDPETAASILRNWIGQVN